MFGTTAVDQVDVKTLHATFQAASEDGCLDKRAFDSCIRKLAHPNAFDGPDNSVSFAMSNIFFAYDCDGTGFVDTLEVRRRTTTSACLVSPQQACATLCM